MFHSSQAYSLGTRPSILVTTSPAQPVGVGQSCLAPATFPHTHWNYRSRTRMYPQYPSNLSLKRPAGYPAWQQIFACPPPSVQYRSWHPPGHGSFVTGRLTAHAPVPRSSAVRLQTLRLALIPNHSDGRHKNSHWSCSGYRSWLCRLHHSRRPVLSVGTSRSAFLPWRIHLENWSLPCRRRWRAWPFPASQCVAFSFVNIQIQMDGDGGRWWAMLWTYMSNVHFELPSSLCGDESGPI